MSMSKSMLLKFKFMISMQIPFLHTNKTDGKYKTAMKVTCMFVIQGSSLQFFEFVKCTF